ncbi:MAG: Rieske 2Fe-2S domain-containing protein [Chloroflexota bacterium]|nr:Rieske 2Fe-2S domain-containing protein [Dehalococcoidia bacterium]MDW8255180.1 Rieske 2Fe-2S domain-containing protein [Chloroflexota bacterium]
MSEPATITPLNNGPYRVSGTFTVTMPSGKVIKQDGTAFLCRCGQSSNKPFCDGTHAKVGFTAEEATEEPSRPSGDGFVAVADESAIKEGDVVEVTVNDQPVALARVGGHLYAVSAICTHQHANLCDGTLDGQLLICPLHGGGFNVRTGQAVLVPPTEPLATYEVRVEGGKVLVSIQPRSR